MRSQNRRDGSPILPLIVARNTFREAVRDRILYNLILFVLLITASAIFVGVSILLRCVPAFAVRRFVN